MGRSGMGKRISLLLFLVGLWIGVPLAWSAGPPQRENVELLSQVGGSALTVFVQGKVAYVGLGPSLHVVDVSSPASPKLLGQITLPGLVEDVFVSGSYAYVANGKFGLRVVDITHPASLQEVGSLDTLGGIAGGIFFSDGFAYVAAGTEGLWIIDVSDPKTPKNPVQWKGVAGTSYGVHVSGSLAYLAHGEGGLQILDVSTPASPSLKGSYTNLPSIARGIYVLGKFAYVADWLGGLRAIDVSNPAAPQKAASYDTPGLAYGVHVSLPYAYVADGGGGLRIINVENSSFFWEVGHLNVPGFNWAGSALGVYAAGSTVYVPNGDFGLEVIDASNPSTPQVVGRYRSISGSAADIFISGIHAYLPAFDYAFHILDLSDPLAPVFKGFYDPPPPESDEHDPPALDVKSLFVTDDWVGIADGAAIAADKNRYGFRAVNVEDPSNPFEDPLWTQHDPEEDPPIVYPITEPAVDLFLLSSNLFPTTPPRTDIFAYVATQSGLTVVDMGPLPQNEKGEAVPPEALGSYTVAGARKIVVAANTTATYAYLIGEFGLKILEVPDFDTPTKDIVERGALATGDPATSIFVSLPYAYMVVGAELWVVQVADLTTGQPLASPTRLYDPIPLSGEATGIFLSGSLAYLTLDGFGLQVFDFTDPRVRPASPIARYETPGQAMDLFIDQGRIYLADGDGGLFLLRHTINPEIRVNPMALDFKEILVGKSAELSLEISNVGARDLIVFFLLDQVGSDFALVDPPTLPLTLPSGSKSELKLQFSPTTEGAKGGSLTLTSNDPDQPILQVALSGNALDLPDIAVDPEALNFGNVALGSFKDMPVKVSNEGSQELEVNSLVVAGAEFSLAEGITLPLTLAPGASQSLTVRFAPTATDNKKGSLTLSSNDPDEGTVVVELLGWEPKIVLEPEALGFGDIAVGSFKELSLKVSNAGAKDLIVSSLRLEGTDFLLVGKAEAPFTLLAGESKQIKVRFSPTSEGAKTGSLTFESNDPLSSTAEVALSGRGGLAPHIGLDFSELDFEEVKLGTSQELLLKVSNTGEKVLTVSQLEVTGSDFSWVDPPETPFTLKPRESRTLTVRFLPTTEGTKTGLLTLTSDDPDNPTATVDLSGKGMDAPQITFTPPTLSFKVPILNSFQDLSVQVSNTGTQDLTVTFLTLTGTDFSLVGELPLFPLTLVPGASRTIAVRFSPTREGPQKGTLTFKSNDPDEATAPVALSGWGGREAPAITLSPKAVDFGDVQLNTFEDHSLVVQNDGTLDLVVSSLKMVGVEFSLVGTVTLPFTLAPGASRTITVRFSPTSEGLKEGSLTLSSNDPQNSTTVPLSGWGGLAPHLALDPERLDFEEVLVGGSKDVPVTISNQGEKSLVVSSLKMEGAEFSLVEEVTVPFTLLPGGSQILMVRFLPTSGGKKTGSLTIASNDPKNPTVQASLSGQAEVVPRIALDSLALDFGHVPLGGSQDLSLSISNIGSQDLIVSSLGLAGIDFSLVNPPATPFTLLPGGSQVLMVRFAPTSGGNKTGSLTIASNDPESPSLKVGLSATPAAPKIQFDRRELDFGNVSVGSANDLLLLVINRGMADLTVTAISFDTGEFSLVSGTLPFTLVPGESRLLMVRFLPTNEGPKQATMTLRSNDLDQPEATLPLSGNAILVGHGPPLQEYVELVSQVGGSSRAIFTQGNITYVGLGSSLHLVDVKEPKNPKLLGRVALPGLVEDIFVSTSLHAYVANGKFGLRVIDVSTPTSPKEVGHFDTLQDFAYGVYVLGSYAYIANASRGLRVVDISDPRRPELKGSGLDTPGTAYDVSVAGSYAYVADGEGGLRVIDISDPQLPREVGAYPAEAGSFDRMGFATGVHVLGSYAYLADGEGGLRSIDVSNPASPIKVGSYNTPGTAYRVFVAFPHAYVADEEGGLRMINVEDPSLLWEVGFYRTIGRALGVSATGTMAYVAGGDFGMEAVDFSNPTVPVVQGSYSYAIGSATHVFLSGRYAYLPAKDYGFRIVDISDPFSPEAKGLHNPPPPNELPKMSAASLFVTDNWAGVADSGHMYRMLDVTDPMAPVEDKDRFWMDAPVLGASDLFLLSRSLSPKAPNVYSYVVGEEGLFIYLLTRVGDSTVLRKPPIGSYPTVASISATFVVGSRAYVASGRSGLKVVDISNPKAPLEMGQVDTRGFAMGVHVSGPYAYVADGSGGLRVIDISTPTAPREVGNYPSRGETAGIFVQDRYAYVADGWGGLAVLDISRPTTPVELGRYPSGGYSSGVAVSRDGRYAYVADGSGGLLILNVSNPFSTPFPNLVNRLETGWNASGVYLSGNLVYVAIETGGLLIVDVTDPAFPVIVGRSGTSGSAIGIYVAGDYAYVADGIGGLRVFNVSQPAAPKEVGSYPTRAEALGILVRAPYAFMSDGEAGLRILDVSLPSNPRSVGEMGVLGAARKIFISTNSSITYAYLAGDFGLLILDVTNPQTPRYRGRLSLGKPANGIFVSFPYAYLITPAGLCVVDISDPTSPQQLYDSIPISGEPSEVFVAGPLVYVTVKGFGLQVFDFTNPQVRPATWVAAYETPGEAMDLFLAKDRIYLSDGDGGLFILRHTLPIGADIALNPESLDFGEVFVGTSRDQSFVIQNAGTADLTVTSLLVNKPELSLVSVALPFTLAPGLSQTVSVRFTPTSTGSKSALLTLLSNDPDEPTKTMALSGQGMPAADLALDPPNLDFGEVGLNVVKELSLKVINRGPVDLVVSELCLEGEAGQSGLCTAGNPPVPFFRINWPPVPFTLPPSGSQDLKVQFKPRRSNSSDEPILAEDLGSKRTVIKIVSNDPEFNARTSARQVSLEGFVVKPPDLRIEPSNLDFGEVAIGSSGELSFVLTNEGAIDLSIKTIASDDAQFSVKSSSPLPAILKPGGGQKLMVTVRFTPSTQPKPGAEDGIVQGEGPQRGVLIVESDDPEITHEQDRVIVSGVGVQLRPPKPDLNLSLVKKSFGQPPVPRYELEFGPIVAHSGRSKVLSFTLFNDGTKRLKVTGISLQGEGFTLTTPAPGASFTIPKGGGSQQVTVRFAPTASGPHEGQLTLASDDPEEPVVVVYLLGQGTQVPEIDLNPPALSFGPVDQGKSGELSFSVRNLGNGPLTVSQLSLDNRQFKVVSPSVPFEVPPQDQGGSQGVSVTVRFTPTNAETQSGTLSLVSNDPDEGTTMLVLSGNDAQVKLLIEGGAPSISQPWVTLTISAFVEIQKMRFSNDGKKWSPWVKVVPAKRWTLSQGQGTKTIWGQFRNKNGQIFEASDTIVQTKRAKP
ncbi:MAG: choice-of-anchor D domain-containing protein [Candidatus Tectomicrobia bacterium]|uniref:Choice-of-anchor D domain-containing protein n=1 Tax=Tectimicrobiota bacterium TaxID=2528274 RepID=A0A932FZS0_UNCTE|nr:choice-of-anchor D domain-containing protein [Candidatus Tectomicrobia bacterium]